MSLKKKTEVDLDLKILEGENNEVILREADVSHSLKDSVL